MTCKDPTGNCLITSSYFADSALNRLHLVITASVTTADIVFFTNYPFGRIDDPLVEASLALNQPNFRRSFWNIRAVISSEQSMRPNAFALSALERVDIKIHRLCNPHNKDQMASLG
jgi:hypothetical protein